MIHLTRRDGSEIFVNIDQIESIEETPDTHITLVNGNRLLVLEKSAVIIERIIEFKSAILRRANTSMKKKYLLKRHCQNDHPFCPVTPNGRK